MYVFSYSRWKSEVQISHFFFGELFHYREPSGFTEALNSGLHMHRERKFYTAVMFFFSPLLLRRGELHYDMSFWISEVVSPASLEAKVGRWFPSAPPGTGMAPLRRAWDWKIWEQMMQTNPACCRGWPPRAQTGLGCRYRAGPPLMPLQQLLYHPRVCITGQQPSWPQEQPTSSNLFSHRHRVCAAPPPPQLAMPHKVRDSSVHALRKVLLWRCPFHFVLTALYTSMQIGVVFMLNGKAVMERILAEIYQIWDLSNQS